jgi:hypothetical protein
MDLEQMQGMQPALYHRYGVLDEGDEDEDEGGGSGDGSSGGAGAVDYSGSAYGTMLAAAMQNMDLNDSSGGPSGSGGEFEASAVLRDVVREREVEAEDGKGGSWSLLAHPGGKKMVGRGSQGCVLPLGGSFGPGSP